MWIFVSVFDCVRVGQSPAANTGTAGATYPHPRSLIHTLFSRLTPQVCLDLRYAHKCHNAQGNGFGRMSRHVRQLVTSQLTLACSMPTSVLRYVFISVTRWKRVTVIESFVLWSSSNVCVVDYVTSVFFEQLKALKPVHDW